MIHKKVLYISFVEKKIGISATKGKKKKSFCSVDLNFYQKFVLNFY